MGGSFGGLAGLSSQLSTASTAVGGSGNGVGSALGQAATYAGMGATLGSVVPGVGTAVGAVVGGLIGGISALVGGHGAPDHERPDLNTIAAANDVTAQQAADVCGLEESHSPRNYDDIVKQAAGDRGYFQQLLAKYNQANPSSPVKARAAEAGEQYAQLRVQAANMFSGTGVTSPLATLSLQGAQQAAASQSMSLEDYLKALLNGALTGAQAGAAGAAADTPAGEAATWATIKAQAKKYELVLVALGLGIGALGYKAFNK
ncbi:MAG: hypothetical protein EOO37_00150 [Cytophagaceae bacterium]|nr:MAG: hypothetical protein EOO37_00150 [Cytophagaceae bacterium]